jgi:hypothetical protein
VNPRFLCAVWICCVVPKLVVILLCRTRTCLFLSATLLRATVTEMWLLDGTILTSGFCSWLDGVAKSGGWYFYNYAHNPLFGRARIVAESSANGLATPT